MPGVENPKYQHMPQIDRSMVLGSRPATDGGNNLEDGELED